MGRRARVRPGYRTNHLAVNQVFPLLTGYLGCPHPPSLAPVMHPVYAYLIISKAGGSILVDSGNPRKLVGQTRATPWFDAPLSMNSDDDLGARLDRIGYSVSDIDLLVATHFDFDHCGNTDLFDQTGIVCAVQKDQLDDAKSSDRYDRLLWDRPGLRFNALNGDTELDHGITLLETSGHAAGHQSLHVEIEDGSLLLTIDAISEPSALAEGPFPAFYIDDAPAWRRSRKKLVTIAESTGAVLIFGHDPGQVELLASGTGPIELTDELRQSGAPTRRAA